jgi:citrate lyase subunit beta/citryl-CoA lyase
MRQRSYLFVPGDRPERYAKALASGADMVVVDLEDAVAPSAKDAARAALAHWLSTDRSNSEIMVRVNGADTPWFHADLDLVARAPRVAAVMMPKAEGHSPFEACGGKPVLALVETAAGIDSLGAILRSPLVQRLAFGSIDLQLDLGIPGDDDALLLFRSQLVLSSRLAQRPAPVDGVCTALGDVTALIAHARRGYRLGFGGQLCVHPAQVETVNATFRPTEEQVQWARRVLAAEAASGGAAVSLDGEMVDRPVIARARAWLEGAASSHPSALVDEDARDRADRVPRSR